jgi:hypothetical protein
MISHADIISSCIYNVYLYYRYMGWKKTVIDKKYIMETAIKVRITHIFSHQTDHFAKTGPGQT